jgi:Ca-activated chloride channel homolog
MKKFGFVFLVIFAFSTFISAQSGRRIDPQPTPERQTVEDEPTFSESKPNRVRPQYIPPKSVREARTKERQKQQSQPTTVKTSTAGDDDLITIESKLVTIPVSVYDRYGLYIPGLEKEDFKIFEEGKEQEIEYFGTTDKPFSVILLLDTSPSTEYKIEEIQAASKAFVRQLKPVDQVMVIEFDGNSHVLTDFTKDRNKINKAIDEADFGYNTSLYDAVEYSLIKKFSEIEGRKAIVLFTDGVDTTSVKATYDKTLYEAEESGVLIFPIYYNTYLEAQRSVGGVFGGRVLGPKGTRPADYAVGKKYLEDLSEITGGKVFRPESTPGGLTKAFEGIAEELRRQYNIGYIPSEDGKPGERRKIKVRVNRPNLVLRARDSYIVGENVGNGN